MSNRIPSVETKVENSTNVDATSVCPNNAKPYVRRSLSMTNLIKAHNKYKSEIENLKNKIQEFVDFEFDIFYQPSDGFILLHVENAHNARLDNCIMIIIEKGSLNYDDYLNECI
jgi:hypothetical protein